MKKLMMVAALVAPMVLVGCSAEGERVEVPAPAPVEPTVEDTAIDGALEEFSETVCSTFDEWDAETALMILLLGSEQAGIDSDQAAEWTGLAVGAYCPEHLPAIREAF